MANVKILDFLVNNNIDFRVEHGSVYAGDPGSDVNLFESGGEYYIKNTPEIPDDITETLYSISFKNFEEFKDIILKWHPFSEWNMSILPFNLIKDQAYKGYDFSLEGVLLIYKRFAEHYTGNISLERIIEGNKKYYHIKVLDTDLYFNIHK